MSEFIVAKLQALCHQHQIHHLPRPRPLRALTEHADLVAVVVGAIRAGHVRLGVGDVPLHATRATDGEGILRAILPLLEALALLLGRRHLVLGVDGGHGRLVINSRIEIILNPHAGEHALAIHLLILVVEAILLKIKVELHHLTVPNLEAAIPDRDTPANHTGHRGIATQGARITQSDRVPLCLEVWQRLNLTRDAVGVVAVGHHHRLVRRLAQLLENLLELEKVFAIHTTMVHVLDEVLSRTRHVSQSTHNGRVSLDGMRHHGRRSQGRANIQSQIILMHTISKFLGMKLVPSILLIRTPLGHERIIDTTGHLVLGVIDARSSRSRNTGITRSV